MGNCWIKYLMHFLAQAAQTPDQVNRCFSINMTKNGLVLLSQNIYRLLSSAALVAVADLQGWLHR